LLAPLDTNRFVQAKASAVKSINKRMHNSFFIYKRIISSNKDINLITYSLQNVII
jgi:hypothetical protein